MSPNSGGVDLGYLKPQEFNHVEQYSSENAMPRILSIAHRSIFL